MFKLSKWIKGIPVFPRMPLFCHNIKYVGMMGVLLYLLEACHTDTRYHVYQPVLGSDGWQKKDSLVFNLPPDVSSGAYGMEIGIRNTGVYPYRDIWLSVTRLEVDSLPAHTDTVHMYLADDKGRWGHEGAIGGLYQQTYVCEKPVVLLTDSVGRSFRVTHLMRRNPLPGISDVGIRLFLTGRVNAEKNK